MKSIILCDHTHLNKTAELCKKYRFGIEAQSFYDPAYIENNPDAINEHLNVLTDIPVRSIHGPFWDLCPGSFDPLIREATNKRFQYAYGCAKAIKADNIVLHHGGYIDGVFTYQKSIDQWFDRSVKFWNEFLNGKDENIKIHIENFLEANPEMMLRLVDEIKRDNFDINLDIGHVNYISDLSVVKWIETLNTRIGYVHIHDNLGNADEHHALGKGNLPLVDIFEALETYSPNAIWAIEHNTEELEDSITWLKNHGYI